MFQEDLEGHIYTRQGRGNSYVSSMINKFETFAVLEHGLVVKHQAQPYDIMVGDDVSGRLPTLMTHRFMRLAQAGGHIETVPETHFMASGRSDHVRNSIADAHEWQLNLNLRAVDILDEREDARVLTVTEFKINGDALMRIAKAFRSQGVTDIEEVIIPTPYAYETPGVSGSSIERRSLGVYKEAPAAVSRRRVNAKGRTIAQFRYFLDDYTRSLYEYAFNEPAPITRPFDRSANAGWLSH